MAAAIQTETNEPTVKPGVISVRLDEEAAEQLSRIVRGLRERTGQTVTTSDAVRDAIELASFTY